MNKRFLDNGAVSDRFPELEILKIFRIGDYC